MLFLNILILLLVFITASLGSAWLMKRLGYEVPHFPQNREDYLIVLMKLLLFAIIALLMFALLLLSGLNPLQL
ncbi:MAG: hypothetical protein EA364_08425 [Balneolaceae bacterium]|nr:MAG: hypothetical protein EA364_08425 [Balneolaceae bacterium]